MNSQRKSPKLLIPAALALAAAVCLVAAGVSAVRDRAPGHSRHAGGGESAGLRVQSLVMRGRPAPRPGRYKEAEPLLREALALAEESFGPDSFETAAVLNQLGMLGKYDGHFDEAEAAYRRALRITEQTAGLEQRAGRHTLPQPRRP